MKIVLFIATNNNVGQNRAGIGFRAILAGGAAAAALLGLLIVFVHQNWPRPVSTPTATLSKRVVYIEIKDPSQRAEAEKIQQELKDKGFDAPGMDEKVNEMPQRTELRYFHEADKAQAEALTKLIQHGATVTFSAGYAKAPPNQYELWLAPNSAAKP